MSGSSPPATNELTDQVNAGSFREDLYYLLSVFPIRVPPLRDRREDIPPLLDHFLDKVSEEYGRRFYFTQKAQAVLQEYGWPGNVREMENLVERLCIMVEGSEIDLKDLPAYLSPAGAKAEPEDQAFLSRLKEMEKREIVAALERNHWIQSQAAMDLGLTLRQIGYRVKQFGLERLIKEQRGQGLGGKLRSLSQPVTSTAPWITRPYPRSPISSPPKGKFLPFVDLLFTFLLTRGLPVRPSRRPGLLLSKRVELQRYGLVVRGGAVELNGAGEAVMVFMGPLLAFLRQKLEGRRLQVHLLLGDHQFQASLALFQVHQGRQGDADGLPVRHRFVQVFDGRHVAGGAVGQEAVGRKPQVVAVVAVELGGEGAPAVIAVVVILGA